VPVLVDTSALYALLDRKDANHVVMSAFLAANVESLVVPVTILPEADYLVATRMGVRVELAMLRAVLAEELHLEAVTRADVGRAAEIVEQYADSDLGFVDASIVAVAERLRLTRLLTFDHRHFAMMRPKHCPALELWP